MGTGPRSEIRFFREEPRVSLGLLLWGLGEEDVGSRGGCRGPWFCLAVRGCGVVVGEAPQVALPIFYPNMGLLGTRSSGLPPPSATASSIKEPRGMKSPRLGPVLRLVPEIVQKEAAQVRSTRCYGAAWGTGPLGARPGSWGDANKSPEVEKSSSLLVGEKAGPALGTSLWSTCWRQAEGSGPDVGLEGQLEQLLLTP